MSLHLNLTTGKFLNSSTLFKLSDALLLDVSSGEIVMSNLLVPRAAAGASPAGLATLDLNFASSLSLDDAVSGNNLITFSRASSGTYVGSDGLIKNSVVNLLAYSEQFDQWTLINTAVATSATTAPNGASTAAKLSSTTGTWPSFCQQSFAGSGTRVLSVFAKAAESSWIALGGIGASDELAWFNLSTGLPGTKNINVISSSMEAFADGWYRCSLVCDFQSFGGVIPVSGDNSLNIAPVGDGIFIWGAQLEEGSTATTYIPTTNAIGGAPRFDHDPVTLQSLGLLIEESRTNLTTYSEETDNTAWLTSVTGGALTVTPNTTIAPNGSLVADTVAADSAITNGRLQQQVLGLTVGQSYTASVYVKHLSGNTDFTIWVPGSSAQSPTLTATTEWQRFSLTFTTANTSEFVRFIQFENSSAAEFAIWGAQVEAGSFPTSYIPTTSAAVTRAADVASITGTNFSSWYNDNEGTWFTDMSLGFTQNAGNPYKFGGVYYTTVTDAVRTLGNGHLVFGLSNSLTVPSKTALGMKPGDYKLYRNGTQPGQATSTSSYVPAGTELQLSPSLGGMGRISRLTYYPTRKTDAELVSLTLPTVLTYGITSPGGVFNLRSTGTVDYEVDWELTDAREASTDNVLPHTYTAGDHTLAVYSDGVYRPYFNNIVADANQITSVVIGPGANLGTNFSVAWYGATNMTSFVCPFDVTSGAGDFYAAWFGTSLTSFPLIDTSSATNLLQTWYNCSSLTSFPLIDTPSVTTFQQAWYGCSSLNNIGVVPGATTSFPLIDTSSGTFFFASWQNCASLISFPLINTSLGTNFAYAWSDCSSLADFPADVFDTTGTLASNAFIGAWFGCALTAQSIENILVSLDTNGQSNITLSINGGTNAAKTTWSAAAVTAYDNLVVKGWTISFNA